MEEGKWKWVLPKVLLRTSSCKHGRTVLISNQADQQAELSSVCRSLFHEL